MCKCVLFILHASLSTSERDNSLCNSGYSKNHSTVTLIGRGSKVEELVYVVAVRLDGVDVLVVRVVGVHHHMHLTALDKSNTAWVRRALSSVGQSEGSEQAVTQSLYFNIYICLNMLKELRTCYDGHKQSFLFRKPPS